MNKKEIDELLQYNLNLKNHLVEVNKQNEELKSKNEFLIEQNAILFNENQKETSETIGHQQNEIETLKSEKEFLMLTINALTKLTNNLIK